MHIDVNLSEDLVYKLWNIRMLKFVRTKGVIIMLYFNQKVCLFSLSAMQVKLLKVKVDTNNNRTGMQGK